MSSVKVSPNLSALHSWRGKNSTSKLEFLNEKIPVVENILDKKLIKEGKMQLWSERWGFWLRFDLEIYIIEWEVVLTMKWAVIAELNCVPVDCFQNIVNWSKSLQIPLLPHIYWVILLWILVNFFDCVYANYDNEIRFFDHWLLYLLPFLLMF